MAAQGNITQLLNLAAGGDADAGERVARELYGELHELARQRASRLPAGETFRPTALVSEAWIKLSGGDPLGWQGRRHFFYVASRSMRDILVDAARRKGADRRGGGEAPLDIDQVEVMGEFRTGELLALDRALDKLAQVDEDGARLVEMRYFGGFTMAEIAESLESPLRSVERKWRFTRAWLRREMGEA